MIVLHPAQLRPGDVILYRGSGLFSRAIMVKTWSRVSHCEGYVGERQSVASRDGTGVALYPLRLEGAVAVLRPRPPFNMDEAMSWFWLEANGQGYDWLGLLAFWTAKLQGRENRKMFCSEFLTRWLRRGGVDPFNGYDADGIAPSEFLKSPIFERVL